MAFSFYIFQCFLQENAILTTITKIGFNRKMLNEFKNEIQEQYPNKKFECYYQHYLMVMREII
jgi:hypothetical protein